MSEDRRDDRPTSIIADLLNPADLFASFLISYQSIDNGKHFTKKRMTQLYTFFQTLKNLNPEGMFGIALPNDDDTLKKAFDYKLLEDVIDFYVIQTAFYRRCKNRDKMKKMCTYKDMEMSIKSLQSSMPCLGNVLLTVQVLSVAVRFRNHTKKYSYCTMCSFHYKRKVTFHGNYNWKYCKDNLQELRDKAMLCNKYQMLGVYIQYIDYDDWDATCHCTDSAGNITRFPGTYVIAAASQGHNTTMAIECTVF